LGRAKDIIIKPISAKDARAIIRELHYSGKVVQNSQIHFGVFLDGKCGGALSFGSSMDRANLIGLVTNTGWCDFIELNRMALADWLPRNGESRAISVCMRLLKKHYPQLKWVVSFADGCQCGDGTIYRASGFVLTGIKRNKSIVEMPDGNIYHEISFSDTVGGSLLIAKYGKPSGVPRASWLTSIGAKPLDGYQLRYIYFLDPSYRERLTVPEIPFSKIDEMGIGMYKGKKRTADDSDLTTS